MDEEKRETFNLEQLIQSGENDIAEFKSSARWDYRESKPNKVLEQVIVKTIAGFLNAKGGTLVIGVEDDGKVVGLDADYKTLSKRPDRDGYQQFLINLVSSNLGKEICETSRDFLSSRGGSGGVRCPRRARIRASLRRRGKRHEVLPSYRKHYAGVGN